MAKLRIEIPAALKRTADQLSGSDDYQWGHMGLCNCGFLCQQVTELDRQEIHRRAMQRHGDWREQLNDYCAQSGLPFDDIITSLLEFGFDADDLSHLERLSDPVVLEAVPGGKVLNHNVKEDVVLYLRTWADLLERNILNEIKLPRGLFTTAPAFEG